MLNSSSPTSRSDRAVPTGWALPAGGAEVVPSLPKTLTPRTKTTTMTTLQNTSATTASTHRRVHTRV